MAAVGRTELMADADAGKAVLEAIRARVNGCVEVDDELNAPSVGLILGSAMNEKMRLGMGSDNGFVPSVVIVLITDPLDIDSKWMTFVDKKLPPRITFRVFDALYKFNPIAAPVEA
ncbi:uncharacterized protein AMSG_04519 [Thecamonas trahens ATCC 50062]|uniref:Uncharacterized protein n=1 Tax=Thecamonas trahens ATCC 50062 TaxID=461836 RepID=A0A0L0D7F7_THETB|nr:hypothetical protein AMSG_04519 [Thecamonas trahens ATCC 50062]KNC48289.1 hypothetical protein AMSG_04519 [Thecamonas trahens ATCC 50062]|eukprot:XP_013758856.1 hypothetical protein AMSG_04519 [Thecamonas trahens ATCC 50062]